MYARSGSFHGRSENIDAGIKFVKVEVGPILDRIDGCRGLSLLVDRMTGQCIVTSSWDNEASMLASEAPLRPLRDSGHAIFGGSMQIDEWEIAVMHRTHHGECCRVTWLEADLDAMTETFRVEILPALSKARGFCSASLLANRTTSLGCATTAWETRGAMTANRTAAEELGHRAVRDAGGEVIDVHEFELAYAHLHVPQIA